MVNWIKYEIDKKEIQNLNLTEKEYEKEIQKLCLKYNL